MPYKLSPKRPEDGKKLCLVIWSPGSFGSLRNKDEASHIGLIAGGMFCDFQFYEKEVADYSKNFGQAWYFPTEIGCEVDKEKAGKIKKLSEKWGAWMAKGFYHQAWPLNCRSYVAYVLFCILGQDRTREWPGLGAEHKDDKQMEELKAFVEKELLA